MDQVFQLVGAVLIVTAFIGAQWGWLDSHSTPYLLVNAVGAGILTIVAALDQDWGFVLLEGVWTLVALWGLLRRKSAPAPGH